MKAEPILQELEAVKEQLAAEAGGVTRRFFDQMEAWLMEHPHAGPVVNSPEELQARLRAREATEPPPPKRKAISGSRSNHCRGASGARGGVSPVEGRGFGFEGRTTEEKIRALKVGDEVLISGIVFARRDH